MERRDSRSVDRDDGFCKGPFKDHGISLLLTARSLSGLDRVLVSAWLCVLVKRMGR